MLLRIFTALVLIPIVVALVWWGPAWLLAAVAALIAIVALLEFFDLGERIAMRAFRKWAIVCAAGLFYAQYSLGLVETHSVAQGYSIVRSAAGGVLSIEAVLLVFVFGVVDRTRHTLGPSRSASGNRDQFGRSSVCHSAVQLPGANQ
jgi:CDP-diglyceride synthetase